jgi:hypothetical protein
MTLSQFISTYNGKSGVGNTPDNKGQCVGLAMVYIADKGYPHIWGHAKDIFANAPTSHYDKLINTPTGVPQPGDIIIWNGNVGGGFGHIAIVTSANVNSFTSLDQNWSVTGGCRIENHNYANVIGWLRFKPLTQGVQVMNHDAGVELYRVGLHREADQPDQWNGQAPAQAMINLRTSPEWQALDAKLKGYDALAAKVAELGTRPTKDQLQAAVDAFTAEQAKVAALEAQVAAKGDDSVLLDEAGNWLVKLFNRIFKKGE